MFYYQIFKAKNTRHAAACEGKLKQQNWRAAAIVILHELFGVTFDALINQKLFHINFSNLVCLGYFSNIRVISNLHLRKFQACFILLLQTFCLLYCLYMKTNQVRQDNNQDIYYNIKLNSHFTFMLCCDRLFIISGSSKSSSPSRKELRKSEIL